MNTPSTCSHFSQCSGCSVANSLTPPLWDEVRGYFQKKGVEPVWHEDGFLHRRVKAKLAVQSGPRIGLYKRSSHEVVDIPNCLVHHPSINKAVAIIKEEVKRQNTPIGEKGLSYIQLWVEMGTGKIQLTLIHHSMKAITPLWEALSKYDIWHSIWLNFHEYLNNRILSDDWKLVFGKSFLWQKIHNEWIPFHPGAFSQVHIPLFEKIIQKIEGWIRPDEKVLELYAGVGAIGLNLQRKTKHLTLVESNPFAYLSFQQCRSNIRFECGDVEEKSLKDQDLIIVDPPRKGLSEGVKRKLCEVSKDRLIYISCNFDSFLRDCEDLLQKGWVIREAEGYLLFSGSNHVEIVALLEKESG